ncbi:MAG TPA: hypothetical protein VHC20_04105 [Candidatus Paceibacterota bacterium]|nr:hypothetical protein [Candidatus Paceibacterota bacterium]
MKNSIHSLFRTIAASVPLTVIGVLVSVPLVSFAGGLFYIDSTTGFAGFGNTTPQAQVDVSGAMYSRLVTATSSAIDWNDGNVRQLTLSSNATLSFSNGHAGGIYDLILTQDATGGRTVTWPASVEWPSGTAPTLSTAANAVDTAHFVFDGTNYLGTFALNYTAASSLLDNIVAYWKFDSDNSTDSVASNNGTDTSMSYGAAKINDGATFNGGSSYINMGDVATRYGTTGLDSSSNSFTYTVWAKQTSTGTNREFFQARQISGGGSQGVDFFIDSTNHLQARFTNSSGTQDAFVSSGTYTDTSSFHYYALVYNSSATTATAYYDGSPVSGINGVTVTKTWSLASSAANLDVGAFGSFASTNWWPGQQDEIGLWSRALSSGDISTLYHSGSGLQYPF